MSEQTISMLVHALLTIAILGFCALLYLSHDLNSQTTAFTFAAMVIGYWFGVYKPPASGGASQRSPLKAE